MNPANVESKNTVFEGTLTVGADDTGYDVKLYGATASYQCYWTQASDRLKIVGNYVNESFPISNTPTSVPQAANTLTVDWSKSNYHNVILTDDIDTIVFLNAKRGQRLLLRITQRADTEAHTVSWGSSASPSVDYDEEGGDATVRWAGSILPTMSTGYSHTDVYGFLCVRSNGHDFDAFIVGQDLPEAGT